MATNGAAGARTEGTPVLGRRWPAVLLGVACVAVLLAFYLYPTWIDLWSTDRPYILVPSGDLVPATFIPASLVNFGSLYLDPYSAYITANWGDKPYFVHVIAGHMVSSYPVFVSFLATPVYAVARLAGWLQEPMSILYAGRIAASLLVAVGLAFYYRLCLERTTAAKAAVLTLALGLGSSLWVTASQGLWQHTGSVPLQFAALLLLILAEKDERTIPWAGLLLGAATAARHNNGTTLAILFVYVWLRYRRSWRGFALLAAVPLVLTLAYNFYIFDSPVEKGYAGVLGGWTGVWWQGLAGLLFSPAKGLLVFSPFLALALVYSVGAWRRPVSLEAFTGLAAWAIVLVLSGWWSWYGGWSFGTRMLTDSLPLWGLLLVAATSRLPWWGWVVFGVAATVAIFVNSLGLANYGVIWHHRFDFGPGDQAWLWDLQETPIRNYLSLYLPVWSRPLLWVVAGTVGASVPVLAGLGIWQVVRARAD